MFERVLRRLREKIRSRQYVMTHHARKEMNDDDLTIYDVERGILTGEISERQKDQVAAEWKYRIRGETLENEKRREFRWYVTFVGKRERVSVKLPKPTVRARIYW